MQDRRLWLPRAPFFTLFLLLVAPLAFGQEPRPAVKLPAGYKLIWNDEFDGKELNLARWEHRYLGKRDSTIVSRDAVSLNGKGQLLLTTQQKGDDLLVGMIGTQKTFLHRYGYFEARIKFEKLQGHHGGFWLQSPRYGSVKDDPGKSGAEIDIIEFFGAGRTDRGAGITVHWNPYPKTDKVTTKPNVDLLLKGKPAKAGAELCDDFHTYAVLWTDKEYVFYIDDKEVFRTTKGLSHTEQYIVLSLLSSDWEKDRLDRKKLPDAMMIDHVRVFAKP